MHPVGALICMFERFPVSSAQVFSVNVHGYMLHPFLANNVFCRVAIATVVIRNADGVSVC